VPPPEEETAPVAAAGEAAPELVAVRLLSFPMDIWLEAREHSEGLLREFKLITLSDPHTIDVPHRLLELADDLSNRFGAFGAGAETQLADAETAHLASVDVTYHLPAAAADAATELGALLDEADRYCAAGRHLLTLVTPPRSLAFRRWFLEEFTRQIGGEAPRSWPDWEAASGEEQRTATD
jgi:hypothetical protein